MIHVSLPALILVYLCLFLGGIFVIWMAGEVARVRRENRHRKFQVVCHICQFHYEDRTEEPLPICPQCGRPNERQDLTEI